MNTTDTITKPITIDVSLQLPDSVWTRGAPLRYKKSGQFEMRDTSGFNIGEFGLYPSMMRWNDSFSESIITEWYYPVLPFGHHWWTTDCVYDQDENTKLAQAIRNHMKPIISDHNFPSFTLNTAEYTLEMNTNVNVNISSPLTIWVGLLTSYIAYNRITPAYYLLDTTTNTSPRQIHSKHFLSFEGFYVRLVRTKNSRVPTSEEVFSTLKDFRARIILHGNYELNMKMDKNLNRSELSNLYNVTFTFEEPTIEVINDRKRKHDFIESSRRKKILVIKI